MSSEGNKDISTEAVSMEQSSTAGAKRKRGRPRKYEYPSYELPPQRAQPIQSIPPLQSTQRSSDIGQVGVQTNHSSGDSIGLKMCTFQVLPAQQAQGNRSGRSRNSANPVNQVNSGKDDILGKRFVGKMTNKFPGFCLITVKVKDNQMLKGWVPDQSNLNPITPKDDLTPELPMLRPSKVQKQAAAIPIQAAPLMPIHLEDVTLAKPLQMRRPVDKTIAKHAIPLTAMPYMSSGAVATVPVSVSPSNVETGTMLKQDNECMISQSPVAAVPITSVQPVSASAKQMVNQDELIGEKVFNYSQKDSESSNGAKGSSVEAEKPNVALVDVVVKDCTGQSNLCVILFSEINSTSGLKESSTNIVCLLPSPFLVAIRETQLPNAQGTDEVGESSGTTDQPNPASCDHQISKELSETTEKGDLLNTRTVDLMGVDDSKSDDVHTVHDEHKMKDDSK